MKTHLFRFHTNDGNHYERQYDWAPDEGDFGALDRIMKEINEKFRQQVTVVHWWEVEDGETNYIGSRWINPVGQ